MTTDKPLTTQSGFSLLEIISVLMILGIVGALVGPFIGSVLGNYIQGRELVERERQANLILERFVRDVRMSKASNLTIQTSCSPSQTLYKNGNDITYAISGSNIVLSSNENSSLLAKHVKNVCFKVQNATSDFNIVSMAIELKGPENNTLKYRTSAVPRQD